MSRNQEQRHVTYDHDLGVEAYQLSGVVQKFPNHFHDFYVIGFIEGGQRHLWCKGREYDLRPGDLILFNPRDNHYCSPIGGELLDYRALNIKPEVMLKAAKEITGRDYAPCFTRNVVCQSEIGRLSGGGIRRHSGGRAQAAEGGSVLLSAGAGFAGLCRPLREAGLCGITLYYLLENIALTLTLASNVGIIISIAPFFTAIFAWLFLRDRRPGVRFVLGFLLAMAGIALLSFGKDASLQLNPIGDLLGVAAAVIWAAYSILTKKVSGFGYDTILTTRRIFFYGLIFMVPISFGMGVHVELRDFAVTGVLPNLLFLGLGASALCFVTWNTAVKHLGSVKTSVYIYMVPVITAVTSALILHETLTAAAVCGIVLTLAGLFLSEKREQNKEELIHGIERK